VDAFFLWIYKEKYIFMDFRRGQDPIKSLRLGYGNKPDKKAWKILEFIGSKGEEGAGLIELSSNDKWGYNYHFPYNKTRATRGYYGTNLYGSGSKPGLLHKYCRKNEKGKWVLERMLNLEKIYMKMRCLN